ncbi:ATP-binding protein [Streptomyces sp. NPDC056061]|uniref:ATP-binding protein n=1 Tax=Streptomyces sp. NPDC056061 TaxID=3345700 RepID=UPI0035DBCA71
MPPTAADLIQGQVLGSLVDHFAFALAVVEEPMAYVRQVVRSLLKDRTDITLINDAVLIATELLTNARLHAGGAISFILDLYEKGVTVGVVDRGADIDAVPKDPVCPLASMGEEEAVALDLDELPEQGQGLYLISECATGWGVERAGEGKVVIAALLMRCAA